MTKKYKQKKIYNKILCYMAASMVNIFNMICCHQRRGSSLCSGSNKRMTPWKNISIWGHSSRYQSLTASLWNKGFIAHLRYLRSVKWLTNMKGVRTLAFSWEKQKKQKLKYPGKATLTELKNLTNTVFLFIYFILHLLHKVVVTLFWQPWN